MPPSIHNVGLHAINETSAALNYTPGFLAFHFIFAYGLLSSRTLKQYYGIDHNVSPRYDLKDFGEEAVRTGKITRRQLEMLKRNESASANAVENYTLLAGALCLANIAGVNRSTINTAGLTYTAARIAYAAIYILVDHPWWSQMRGITWWIGNGSCLFLLWRSWQKLNS
ncbi:hypothetical protein AMS68_000123 [Peltaster fructicola]|uniref:MAPEG family protein n=1 Tax=Peltaster fructicola TaxID=286661 RepID=A0A6H0XIR0_9PEZI|nr:hypothetical protein AMS68_000123 [Peltaster fructicola]